MIATPCALRRSSVALTLTSALLVECWDYDVTWRPMDTEDSDVNARIDFRRTHDWLVVAEHHLIVDRLSSTLSGPTGVLQCGRQN